MEFLSFNLRIDLESDGINRFDLRLPHIARFLDEGAYPLVCTQEVDPAMLRRLLQAMPRYRSVGLPRDDGRGEGTPILYDPEKLTLERAETRWLTETPAVPSTLPGSRFPRIAVIAVFRTPRGRRFRVVNTHFDYGEAAVRLRQTDILLGLVAKEQSADPLPCLVLGDFNAEPDEPLHQAFRRARFRSAYGAMIPAHTFHAFGNAAAASTIDYVYGRGVRFKDARVLPSAPYGRFLSDHDPVWVECNFR